jgi:hypothetical protein
VLVLDVEGTAQSSVDGSYLLGGVSAQYGVEHGSAYVGLLGFAQTHPSAEAEGD